MSILSKRDWAWLFGKPTHDPMLMGHHDDIQPATTGRGNIVNHVLHGGRSATRHRDDAAVDQHVERFAVRLCEPQEQTISQPVRVQTDPQPGVRSVFFTFAAVRAVVFFAVALVPIADLLVLAVQHAEGLCSAQGGGVPK